MEEPKRKKFKGKSSKANKQDTLTCRLPFDVIEKIQLYLDDPFDLATCLFVSKEWNSAASQSCLWKKFVKKEFGDYFDGDDDCNWLQVYKNFHEINIQEELWVDIDDLEDTISCPFCQSDLLPFEEDADYYVMCNCKHQFRISVVTQEQHDHADKNYCEKYDLFCGNDSPVQNPSVKNDHRSADLQT